MRSKIVFALLLGFGSIFAFPWSGTAPQNYTGYQDTASITAFSSDSLRTGGALQWSDFENKVLIVCASDTNGAAGFAADSLKFRVGYQRGYVVQDINGKVDTTWRAICWADTFCLTVGQTAKVLTKTSSVTMDSTGQETVIQGMIDTSNVTGMAVLTVPVSPVWSPLVRPVVKGLTGNRTVGWLKVICSLSQRMYIPMRQK